MGEAQIEYFFFAQNIQFQNLQITKFLFRNFPYEKLHLSIFLLENYELQNLDSPFSFNFVRNKNHQNFGQSL